VLHGHYHLGSWRSAFRNRYCTTCQTQVLAEGRRSIIVLHFCWIPILPIGTIVRWFCFRCGHEVDARRPSRTWILIAGVVFAVFLTFLGTTMLTDAAMRPAGIGALLFSPILATLLIRAIRRQNYDRYVTASKSVIPLDGRNCPVCGTALFASARPRCHTCRADVITQ